MTTSVASAAPADVLAAVALAEVAEQQGSFVRLRVISVSSPYHLRVIFVSSPCPPCNIRVISVSSPCHLRVISVSHRALMRAPRTRAAALRRRRSHADAARLPAGAAAREVGGGEGVLGPDLPHVDRQPAVGQPPGPRLAPPPISARRRGQTHGAVGTRRFSRSLESSGPSCGSAERAGAGRSAGDGGGGGAAAATKRARVSTCSRLRFPCPRWSLRLSGRILHCGS